MLKWIKDVGIINPEDVVEIRYKLGKRLRPSRAFVPGPLMKLYNKLTKHPERNKPVRLAFKWLEGGVILKMRGSDDIFIPVKGGYDMINDRSHDVLDEINAACIKLRNMKPEPITVSKE